MRLFIATLGTETNTFASFPTGIDDFKECFWADRNVETFPASPWSAPPQIWRERGIAAGWEVIQSLFAFANPAGPTIKADYEAMRDRILGDLRAAGPVDAVLYYLHGAMIADGYDDCEGDLVKRTREVVGSKTRIGIELDLHGHV